MANRFDKVDKLIDLHGHIIGMGLSPDSRSVPEHNILKTKQNLRENNLCSFYFIPKGIYT